MDYGHRQADIKLRELEKKIRREYQKASEEVEKSMNNYLKHMYRNDAEMRMMWEADLITEAQYIDWRYKQTLITKKWLAPRSEMTLTYLNADKVAQQMLFEHRIDVYALNFNYGTFEAEMLAGLDTGFTIYNREAVVRLMTKNPKLLPEYTVKVKGVQPQKLSSSSRNAERILRRGKLKRWNEEQLQSAVTQKILQGQPLPKLAKEVATIIGTKNMVQAIRTARTMTTSAENAGRLDSYLRARDHGIEMGKMWITLHDERVRKSHRAMDGEVVSLDDAFSNGLMYPADPDGEAGEVYNCRCRLGRKLLSVNGVDMSDVMETDYSWDGDFEKWVEERS